MRLSNCMLCRVRSNSSFLRKYMVVFLLFTIVSFIFIWKDFDILSKQANKKPLVSNLKIRKNVSILDHQFHNYTDIQWGYKYLPLRILCMIPTLYPQKLQSMKVLHSICMCF